MTYTFDELKALIEKRGVHPEFGEPGENFGIEQNSFELATFLVRMQELNVQTCLEIGTGYKGGLSRFLAHDMGWDVTTYDIQNYGHVFEGVHYIVGNTPRFNHSFDLVFIDGNHDYDAVKTDYGTYSKLATKVIAFHDILGQRGCMDVRKFWLELTGNPKTVSTRNQVFAENQSSGIGWIEL